MRKISNSTRIQMIIMVMSKKNKSVFGTSSNFIAGSTYLFGPNIKGPVFFENTGSVIIVVLPNLIRKVAWPIQTI